MKSNKKLAVKHVLAAINQLQLWLRLQKDLDGSTPSQRRYHKIYAAALETFVDFNRIDLGAKYDKA